MLGRESHLKTKPKLTRTTQQPAQPNHNPKQTQTTKHKKHHKHPEVVVLSKHPLLQIEKNNTKHATNNYPHTQNTLMKRAILITGTPCTGKTTIAKQLTTQLNAHYINLTDYANKHHLTIGKDKQRKTTIINEEKMRTKITETIQTTKNTTIIIDGHYAPAVVPTRYVTRIFVLRRNPTELHKLMKKRGFSGNKLWENLASEILDVCLIEALHTHAKKKVCELDITGKTAESVSHEILSILTENKECRTGCVDWLGMLEKQGLTDKYLKV
jgi:adenylate kinase